MLSYQAVRVEDQLTKNGKIDYDSLVTLTGSDFSNFVAEYFINIIGSENIEIKK